MIISGERRYRAAKEAGLRELPCIEMEVDDRAVAEIALIENLQRKDLTAFEEAEGLLMLIERFGYTHEEVGRKIGKSRSSVTEALSIALLPADVKEECRRADIASKSLLLQVVRQPNQDSMKSFLKRIVEHGFNRDEAREARTRGAKKSRPSPYVFRYTHPAKEFVLEVKFRRSSVSREELKTALAEALAQIESQA
jgi:ParB family chromosome partitioning protein